MAKAVANPEHSASKLRSKLGSIGNKPAVQNRSCCGNRRRHLDRLGTADV